MKRSCGTQPSPDWLRRCVGMAARSVPRQRSVPARTRVSPISVTSSVVLPMPLRPSSARLSPASSPSETSSSTTPSP